MLTRIITVTFLFIAATTFSQKQTVLLGNVITEIEKLETGKIYANIRVSSDTNQSYALYLPKIFNATTYLPTILFFDPHGQGNIPLELYKELAEQYGFLLAASNSSKNGMKIGDSKKIANDLFAEIRNKFHPNLNKLSICGFSGGAKVALVTASERDDIKYCIYIGAVAPIQSITHSFTFIGFAGNKDMNYIDLISFEDALADSQVPHLLMQTSNKHEWTTPNYFSDAFLFIKKDTVLGKFISVDDSIRNNVKEENRLREGIIKAVYNENTTWWKNKMEEFNTQKSTEKEQLLSDRLKGFTSLFCYTATNNALRLNSLGRVESLLPIYKIADPYNPDQPLLKAAFYVQKNEPSKAIAELLEAEKLGLKDASKLTAEPMFEKLKNNSDFKALLERLH